MELHRLSSDIVFRYIKLLCNITAILIFSEFKNLDKFQSFSHDGYHLHFAMQTLETEIWLIQYHYLTGLFL